MISPKDELLARGHRACAGCGVAIAIRQILKAVGKNCIVVNATGCSEIFTTPYPESAWKVPYVHCVFENAASIASGVKKALEVEGREEVHVVCIAGDGATYDIGFGALSGMFERGDDVLYICYDNEAYMNTGVQRSSATPFRAATTTSQVGKSVSGKQERKKPIVEIAAAHGIPYAASTSMAFPNDVEKKIKKAMMMRGPKFICIHASCVPGWGYASNLSVELAKLAVETGMWKLYEIEDGTFTLNMKPQKKPVADYLKQQKRFKHLKDDDIEGIQKMIDAEWEALESESAQPVQMESTLKKKEEEFKKRISEKEEEHKEMIAERDRKIEELKKKENEIETMRKEAEEKDKEKLEKAEKELEESRKYVEEDEQVISEMSDTIRKLQEQIKKLEEEKKKQ